MALSNVAGTLVYFNEIVKVVDTCPELKRTFTGMAKQVGAATAGTIAGAVVAGPPGALVGGVLGCYAGYLFTNDYKALVTVLRNLTDEEKYELQCEIQRLVGSSALSDFLVFIKQEVNRQLLFDLLKNVAPIAG